MNYKFEGDIKVIMDVQSFDSGFKKREIVITSDDQYPQDIKFEFLKDDVDMLKSFKPNERVIIDFSLRGNEYNGKYYSNLIGNGITKVKVSKSKKPAPMPDIGNSGDDDLPF